jgi:RND family efflux transporter MFP subunit
MTDIKPSRRTWLALALLAGGAVACGDDAGPSTETEAASPPLEAVLVLRDTTYPGVTDAVGTAEPFAAAVLSTKLAGTVTSVLVREGDRVTAGRTLARIDVRDLAARADQLTASIAAAEASHREAELQATRMRALFADSAASRAQLDAAEAGLARATAALGGAHAQQAELGAVTEYGNIRAPFDGVVVARLVDPGAFAAPGVPLLRVEDAARLRVAASVVPDVASRIRPGTTLPVTIEGRDATGVVEGVVPVTGAGLYTVNVIVQNRGGAFLAGSAARVAIPTGETRGLLVPRAMVRTEGELTGVRVRSGGRTTTRWIRVGRTYGELVEVLSGLSAGDTLVLITGPES